MATHFANNATLPVSITKKAPSPTRNKHLNHKFNQYLQIEVPDQISESISGYIPSATSPPRSVTMRDNQESAYQIQSFAGELQHQIDYNQSSHFDVDVLTHSNNVPSAQQSPRNKTELFDIQAQQLRKMTVTLDKNNSMGKQPKTSRKVHFGKIDISNLLKPIPTSGKIPVLATSQFPYPNVNVKTRNTVNQKSSMEAIGFTPLGSIITDQTSKNRVHENMTFMPSTPKMHSVPSLNLVTLITNANTGIYKLIFGYLAADPGQTDVDLFKLSMVNQRMFIFVSRKHRLRTDPNED